MARPESKTEKPRGQIRTKAFWILVYVTLTLLLVIGVALIVRQSVIIPGDFTPPQPLSLASRSPTPTLPPDATPLPTPEPTPYIKYAPKRIYFDSHKLQSDIRPVGLASDNSIDTVPSATISGWYEDSAAPGDAGNAIIGGHVTWKGKKGIFSVLHDVEPGEQITVEFENGMVRYFEVTSKNVYAVADFPSFVTDLDGDARLTLITCLGDYDRTQGMSLSRVVVECFEKTELRQEAPLENT